MALPKLQLHCIITCPACNHQKEEIMPTNACQFFYTCEKCFVRLSPKKGDCCVFCSYGDTPCPPIQEEKFCCQDPKNHLS